MIELEYINIVCALIFSIVYNDNNQIGIRFNKKYLIFLITLGDELIVLIIYVTLNVHFKFHIILDICL